MIKPQLMAVKVETREPDIIKEIKRSNMKEKWGLSLLFRILNGRLEICVNKGMTMKLWNHLVLPRLIVGRITDSETLLLE